MNFFVYYLYSEKIGRYYLGQTDSLEYRIWEHNTGSENFTRRGAPWKLVGYIPCSSRAQAVQIESKLKRTKNKNYIKWFIEKNGKIII
ncbi:MAG: GIY-YIG nuclease family protein [Nanoarchaeota archaeon]